MSMHSMTFFVIFLFLAIVVVGAVFALVRVFGARAVNSDHTADPNAPRPDDFGAKDRRRAHDVEGRDDPEVVP